MVYKWLSSFLEQFNKVKSILDGDDNIVVKKSKKS